MLGRFDGELVYRSGATVETTLISRRILEKLFQPSVEVDPDSLKTELTAPCSADNHGE
jgi:hypothetical protein